MNGRFSINGVQMIDAAGKPWNQNNRVTGSWRIGFFAASVSSTAANAATWCRTGTSFSVVGMSGADEPLLLDGTLG